MTSLSDLSRQVDSLPPPPLDIDVLVARGELRLRRGRLTAVAMAAVVVLVMVVGGVLVGRGGREATRPIEHPERHEKAPARKIVYGDGVPGRAIHFGGRKVETGVAFAQIDMTDNGFIYDPGGYLGDGRLWFSDGGRPEQIASHVCIDPHGGPGEVTTANVGTLAAWFTCARHSPQSLVVFDTASGREVVHRELAECPDEQWVRFGPCAVDALIDGHVYITQTYYRHGGSGRVAYRSFVFDLAAGALSGSSPGALADDLRQQARGLVLGDSWSAGTPATGIGVHFDVTGSKLVPEVRLANGEAVRAKAFTTVTGQAVMLRLPSGHRGSAEGFELFEWLDDDTVALVAGGGWGWFPGYGDILTCTVSDGQCDLTVRGRANGKDSPPRVVPHLGLPG